VYTVGCEGGACSLDDKGKRGEQDHVGWRGGSGRFRARGDGKLPWEGTQGVRDVEAGSKSVLMPTKAGEELWRARAKGRDGKGNEMKPAVKGVTE